MKKMKIIPVIFVIIAVSATAIICSDRLKSKIGTSATLKYNYDNTAYGSLWRSADSLSSKGLTRSVLEVVNGIYEKARKEENAPQFVKSVIYRLKFESYIEEESYVKAIYKVSEQIKTAKYPIKPVMHSLLASIYWRYYVDNRWKFSKRSHTVKFKPDDIRTWDLKRLVEQTILNFTLSLENQKKLKSTPVNIYDEIIDVRDKNLRKLRPTLYDFLAHRAVDFFMNEEPDIVRPAYKFEIDDKNYFSPARSFAKIKIVSKDTLSLKIYAFTILQDLIAVHLKDKDPAALIDADLKRLKFVRAKAILENKDSLFLNALFDLKKRFQKHPSYSEIMYEIANVYYRKGVTYRPLVSDTNKWELKKAHDICSDIIASAKEDSYGVGCCNYLRSLIEQKSLQLIIENVNVPEKDFRAYLSYKNLSEVFIRIVKIKPKWYYNTLRKYYGEELIKKYLKQPNVMEWKLALENDGDFQQHAVEAKIAALPSGFYMILVASSSDFTYEKNAIAYTPVWVSNISYMKRTTKKSETEYFILDRTTGKPLKNVSAQVFYQDYSYKTREYTYQKGKKYVTDVHGYFSIPPAKKSRRYYLEFIHGKDMIHSENLYGSHFYSREKKKQLKTIFFTDRSIYRPGQTVYFKGIMLETDGETTVIKPAVKTTVTFFDVNRQKIEETILESNDFGTFNGAFTAPIGVLNGRMSIRNSHGSAYFRVEEYKRPKFEVTIDPVKEEYRVNDMVSVKGEAKAYAGSNIDNARVKYRVVRTTSFPFWCFWWHWYYPSTPEMEITNGTSKTDEKGNFSLSFKAIPDHSIAKRFDPRFTYTVFIDVTDINGETHSTQKGVMVGYTALNLSINIPAKLDREFKEKLLINTTNFEGQYQYAKGTISIHKLKQPEKLFRKRMWTQPDRQLLGKKEYYATFPFDLYADEDNIQKWEKGKQVFKTTFDTKKDSLVQLNKLHRWKPGQYLLEAESKDKYGETVKAQHYFTVYSTKEKSVPENTFNWFTAVKTVGEPGETIPILIGTRASDVSILYEIEHKEQIVHKEWMTLNKAQKKIEVPIKDEYRGNFSVHVTFIKENRNYQHDISIIVPYTNKQLDLEFETFRNKLLPGQKEEWKLKVKGKKEEKITAELLAGMYDASLDAFSSHAWMFNIYQSYYTRLSWQTRYAFTTKSSNLFDKQWNKYYSKPTRYYDRLNVYGFDLSHHYGYFDGEMAMEEAAAESAPAPMRSAEPGEMKQLSRSKRASMSADEARPSSAPKKETLGGGAKDGGRERDMAKKSDKKLTAVKTRTNFNETAFFFPHLKTNKDANIIISFTIPEALTRWKFMGFAHTMDLKFGHIEKEVITQKDLMVMPNPPRFFREHDKITFSAKVSNISKKDLTGTAKLMLFDALTMKPVDKLLGNTKSTLNFKAKKGQSTALNWNLAIPEGIQAVTYRVVATSGKFSDGEEMALPVMTNRMLVTESMPLPIRGKKTKEYTFKKLMDSGKSKTLKNHKLTLEYTSNPAWYAIQALPYLMEYPYDCSEQIFSRFYANSIASHIANSSPKIKRVFDSWRNITPDALLSNLEKNQELKSLLLQETPWVLQAKDESQRKRNVGILFDLNRMANELRSTLFKLQKLQVSNGGWPWFKGMPDNRYITQHIVTGFGHLNHLGIKNIKGDKKTWNMTKNALRYLDNRIREDYEWLLKHHPDNMHLNHLRRVQIQYLYARSYFLKDVAISKKNKKAFEYYKGQSQKYWLENNRYLQGMIALALYRLQDEKTPKGIMKSLKQNAIFSEELGMYWNDIKTGYYWYQAPIETMALLIEAFDEVAKDQKSVEALKVWLLKNKQTNDWKTTKATTEACYALLLKGTDWLAEDPKIEIAVGDIQINPQKLPEVKVEAGTGYFKTSWPSIEIKPQMGKVTVKKGDEGVSWGALYWQYFEQLDKITIHDTPLKLKKQLFIERNTASGPIIEPVKTSTLTIGDKVIVRIELRVDRDMEYIHMKDMRGACFEPINVISQYKYQDGLGYYESTKDASTNFFISHMSKGTYIFEYPLRVSHKGDFSNGITSIQCMYAPEFASHSEGIRVSVK